MNVLIFEDEKYVAKRLIKQLDSIDFEYNLLKVISKVEDAVKWLQENPMPDLIFADVQLIDGTSFDIFEQVKVTSYVIFTTSFDEYAIQAFTVNSIDYLLKPVLEDELQNAVNKMMNMQREDNMDVLLKQLKSDTVNYKSRFLIKKGRYFEVIPTDDIAYFFLEDGMNYIMTAKGKKHSLDTTLEDIAGVLDPQKFFRINRQMIVNVEAIRKISSFFNSRLLLVIDPPYSEDVIVTRSRSTEFKEWLDG